MFDNLVSIIVNLIIMKFQDIHSDNDIKRLASLAREIWRSYWPILLSEDEIEYMINLFQSFDAIKRQIKEEGFIYKILKDENNTLGYLAVCKKSKPYNHLYLSKIYLKDGQRGKGAGWLMFDEIKKIASGLNLDKIRLNVNKRNFNSIKTYERWGLKTLEAIVVDIGDGYVMDDYVMECTLDNSGDIDQDFSSLFSNQ